MSINRGLLFWGVALVTAGALALAAQLGGISPEILGEAWRYWPLILVLGGVAIVADRTPLGPLATLLAGMVLGAIGGALIAGAPFSIGGCDGEMMERTAQEGTFSGTSAEVQVDFSCGDLDLEMGPGAGWSVDLARGGGRAPIVESDAARLRLESEGGGFFGGDRAASWSVILPSEVELDASVEANAATSRLVMDGGQFSDLGVDANAGDVTLDLRGARVETLEVDLNAGSLTLRVDADAEITGAMSVNAGSIDICAAGGLAIAITLADENVTFSHDLDEGRLERSGDTWSAGTGSPSVSLEVEGNAASLSYNDEEACA